MRFLAAVGLVLLAGACQAEKATLVFPPDLARLDAVQREDLDSRGGSQGDFLMHAQQEAVAVIQQRLDGAGIEARVEAGDNGAITVWLEDAGQAKRATALTQIGRLGFYAVAKLEEARKVFRAIEEKFPGEFLPHLTQRGNAFAGKANAVRQVLTRAQAVPGLIPENRRVVLGGPTPADAADTVSLHLIETPAMLNGGKARLASARPNPDVAARWMVLLELDTPDGARLRELTGARIGEPLAMMLDERLVSVPVVRSAVGPAVALAGFDSEEEARNVAAMLRSGPLPYPLAAPYRAAP